MSDTTIIIIVGVIIMLALENGFKKIERRLDDMEEKLDEILLDKDKDNSFYDNESEIK